jgi:hypothetical protein
MYSSWIDNTEKEDSEVSIELDEENYPMLPDNILELRLARRKAILRQFMAASRCMYCF